MAYQRHYGFGRGFRRRRRPIRGRGTRRSRETTKNKGPAEAKHRAYMGHSKKRTYGKDIQREKKPKPQKKEQPRFTGQKRRRRITEILSGRMTKRIGG